MLQGMSYAKDIAHNVGTGSVRGGEEMCGGGEGGHGDSAGHGVCRGREWGLAFCMWSAMPRYIIVLPDSMSFRYRSCQMSNHT